MPNKLVGVYLTATDEGNVLDQSHCDESIVLEDMGSNEVRKMHTLLDPGMDLSANEEHDEELDISLFPYSRILGNSCSQRE